MLSRNHPGRIRIAFDEHRLVLQRQFKAGCPRMPGGQRGVSRESG